MRSTCPLVQDDWAWQLRTHLSDFVADCNFAKRLKTLGGSPLTNLSANAGKKNQTDLLSIQPINAGTKHLVGRVADLPSAIHF